MNLPQVAADGLGVALVEVELRLQIDEALLPEALDVELLTGPLRDFPRWSLFHSNYGQTAACDFFNYRPQAGLGGHRVHLRGGIL